MRYSVYSLLVSAGLLSLLGVACDPVETIPVDTNTYEATVNINPNNVPAGAGLDLNAADSGQVAQLDSVPNFLWDIKMLAYRTSQGGRPAIFLFGDESAADKSLAVNVSEEAGIGLGLAGFNSFTEVTTDLQTALQADGSFDFDPQTDVDGQGNPDGTKLAEEYAKLVIGDKVVNLDEADQPVFLISSREGLLYKFQLVNREGGGNATLRWARLDHDSDE